MEGALFAGTRRFEVLSRLGAGGMGVVYRALDRERRTEVALKTMNGMEPAALLRFKNEFRSLAHLSHPNLVTLGELFVEGGQWFFTMELVAGSDFLSWVRRGADPDVPVGEASTAAAMPRGRVTAPMDEPALVESRPSAARAAAACDEGRLRAGLAQLARGLRALHDAGKVHRDVKPANVLVTEAGRVVLLDFGLATDVHRAGHQTELEVFGTAAYIAPEQAAAQPVGPESDWYSVGVMLYEALTGRLPFEGSPLEIVMEKQRREPPPPSALMPGIARDLDDLARGLLRFARGQRLGCRDVLRVVDREGRVSAHRPAQVPADAAPFVGRSRELEFLAAARRDSSDGKAVAVIVDGESGVGKSAVVRRFLDGLDPPAVVLAGRCHQRESVPYRGVDGVIDALSRHLRRLSKADAAALLPRRAGLLVQVFPVLGRVDVLAEAPRARVDALDPQQLRGQVFAAVREMLARLAERQSLVVVIDDLQWADADSMALLSELLRPPDAPGLLLVATSRSALDIPGAGADVRQLHVDRLPAGDAAALAGLLLRTGGRDVAAGAAAAAAIASEADGHPLFIDELVRHALLPAGQAQAPVRLEDALWLRINQLDRSARLLLELAAVAGMPLSEDVLGRAAQLAVGDFHKYLHDLRVGSLLQSGPAGVEPFHDRVRAAVIEHLDQALLSLRHRELAAALEEWGQADPEALAVHWRGAGESAVAAGYSAQAAQRAAEAFAFHRAAQLYRQALSLLGAQADPGVGNDDTGRGLRAKLGDALANAGRGAEAAEVFLAAAHGAPAPEALDLQRRAAEQLLISGHIDAGLEAIRRVLADMGMRMPLTPRRARTSALVRRAWVRLRGIRFRERDAATLDARDLARIDVCWSVGIGLGMADHVRGADFQARHLLLALRAGDPFRVARALALEVDYSATAGGRSRRRTAKLLDTAWALERRLAHPHLTAWVTSAHGGAAFLEGRWRESRTTLERAEEILAERCTGVVWELDTARHFTLSSLAFLGELDELARRLPILIREAQDRGDRYGATNLRIGHEHIAWLAAGDPEGARRDVADAMSGWSSAGFHIEHFYELLALGQIDLYTGDAADGLRRLSERWSALRRSLLLHVQIIRIEMMHLRARLAVAAATAAGTAAATAAGTAAATSDLLRAAERFARRVARERMAWATPLAQLVLAAVACARGHREQAADLLAVAAGGFDAADMALHAAAARYRRGQLIGGREGLALVGEAGSWLAKMNVKEPERLLAVIAPGLPDPAP